MLEAANRIGFSVDVIDAALKARGVLPTQANIAKTVGNAKDTNGSRWYSQDEIARSIDGLVKKGAFKAKDKFTPTLPIGKALEQTPKAVDKNYDLYMSPDNKTFIANPDKITLPKLRATRAAGVSSTLNRQGGRNVKLESGAVFDKARWVRSSLRDLVRDDGKLQKLRDAGFRPDTVQDLLVVTGRPDEGPIFFAFRPKEGAQGGLASICKDVDIHDFSTGTMIVAKKPVIYLYPDKQTTVRVEVKVRGDFVAQYPKSNNGKWEVTAQPDGTLIDPRSDRRYGYLFWEAKTYGSFDLDSQRTHCVRRADLESFLETACAAFGLNARETTDFISYWIAPLSKKPFALIQFLAEKTYGESVKMTITPAPDTLVRMFMIFRGSNEAVKTGNPALPKHTRRGFTAVEWGGADLDA